MAALEPIGGEGIGLAMRSAELAAAWLLENPTASVASELRARFHQLWQTRRLACRAAALAVSAPVIANFALHPLDGREAPIALMMRLMGKSG